MSLVHNILDWKNFSVFLYFLETTSRSLG